MKKVFIYLGLLAAISSCLPVYFEQPQPAGIEAEKIFPKKLQGVYFEEGNDITIKIDELTFEYGNEDTILNRGQLSDSLILKKYKKYFFLNLKNDDLWSVYVVSKKNDIKLLCLTIPDLPEENQRKEKKLEKLGKITVVKEIPDSDGDVHGYAINPTKKELETLLREKMFVEEWTLKEIEK